MTNSYWTYQLLSVRQTMINDATENSNLTVKTGNGHRMNITGKRIQNKKKIKNQVKNRKKENQLS